MAFYKPKILRILTNNIFYI